jgi:glycosyltransferase involved in cell wall biosynthesis
MLRERKILFVTQNIAPYRAKWLSVLAKYIKIDIFHLNERSSGMDLALPLIEHGEGIKAFDISRYLFSKYKIFQYKKIKNHIHDILILDGYGFFGQMLLILVLKLSKTEFFLSVDGGFIRKKEFFFKRLFKSFYLSSAKGYFSTSTFTDDYISHYVANPGKIYRHYFSSIYSHDICTMQQRVEYHKTYRKELGLSGEVIVLTVGQFIPRKGFDILLEASKLTGKRVHYIFAGGTPTKEYLDLMDETNQDSVQFINFLDPHQLKKHYLACDIFVLPTREDIWGLVVGEAMACGCPIISSDKCIAALSMVENGENGFIVYNESPEQYAACIDKLASDENMRTKMSEQSLKKVYNYAIDISCKNDVESLNDIITGKAC